jgi:hypothetical protein
LSKIFEALKQAESARINSGADAAQRPERRRTPRVRVQIPLLVYGYKGKNPFHEDACTVEVNAHGGLISMRTALRPRQKLLVMNKGSESKERCIVLAVRARQERGFDVVLEFLDPAPQFWQDLEISGSPHL